MRLAAIPRRNNMQKWRKKKQFIKKIPESKIYEKGKYTTTTPTLQWFLVHSLFELILKTTLIL